MVSKFVGTLIGATPQVIPDITIREATQRVSEFIGLVTDGEVHEGYQEDRLIVSPNFRSGSKLHFTKIQDAVNQAVIFLKDPTVPGVGIDIHAGLYNEDVNIDLSSLEKALCINFNPGVFLNGSSDHPYDPVLYLKGGVIGIANWFAMMQPETPAKNNSFIEIGGGIIVIGNSYIGPTALGASVDGPIVEVNGGGLIYFLNTQFDVGTQGVKIGPDFTIFEIGFHNCDFRKGAGWADNYVLDVQGSGRVILGNNSVEGPVSFREDPNGSNVRIYGTFLDPDQVVGKIPATIQAPSYFNKAMPRTSTWVPPTEQDSSTDWEPISTPIPEGAKPKGATGVILRINAKTGDVSGIPQPYVVVRNPDDPAVELFCYPQANNLWNSVSGLVGFGANGTLEVKFQLSGGEPLYYAIDILGFVFGDRRFVRTGTE